MSRPHPRARYFFLPWHQLLHCIPTLQKRSDSLPHPADTRGSPSCHVRSLFLLPSAVPIHPERTILLLLPASESSFRLRPCLLPLPGSESFRSQNPPVFSASPALFLYAFALLHCFLQTDADRYSSFRHSFLHRPSSF